MASSPALPIPSARVYPKFRWQPALSAAIALLPLACLARMCVLHHVDVPYWDDWALVPRLAHMASGTLTFHDFWQQHNEHRPLVPIALMLLLARFSHWNISWEIAVNVLLGAGIFGVFWVYTRHAWRRLGGAPAWLLPFISLLVFSPVQWENWTWGFQMTVLMCTLASVLTAYLVSRSGVSRAAFAGSVASAVWASYSVAGGLLLWIVQPLGLWLSGERDRAMRLAIWIAAGTGTFASYFYGYHPPSQPSMLSTFTSIRRVWTAVQYGLAYLGSPVTAFAPVWAPYAGAIVIVSFVWLLIRLRPLWTEPVFLFPALVGLQTLSTAAAAALNRAWLGVDQAVSSRYCTISIPIWCAMLCLVALRRSTAPAPFRLRHVVAAAALVGLLACVWTSGGEGAYYARGRAETLHFARRGLIVGRSDTMLLMLYPNLADVRAYRKTLLRLHLSVFRPTARPAYPRPLDSIPSAGAAVSRSHGDDEELPAKQGP